MSRASDIRLATAPSRLDRPGSSSRRDGVVRERDDDMTPAVRRLTGAARVREAVDSRAFLLILLAGLTAFGWLLLVRNVRVGIAGDLGTPRREAVEIGRTTPADGAAHARASGLRPGSETPGPG